MVASLLTVFHVAIPYWLLIAVMGEPTSVTTITTAI
jgi:hypothetical protein